MTEVVNFRDVQKHWNPRAETWDSPKFVYMGRENQAYHLKASPFANPFPIKRNKGETEVSARQRSLANYLDYISRRSDLLAQLPKYRGKVWVCWCKPLPCHCDVLVKLLDAAEVNLPKMPASVVNMALDLIEADIAPAQQVGMDGSRQPVLAWDKGGAAFESAKDRNNWFYRTDVRTQHPIGLPGKVYTTWAEWRRDFFRLAFQVKTNAVGMCQADYARFRYETALKAREGLTDEISRIECEVLHELLAELDGQS